MSVQGSQLSRYSSPALIEFIRPFAPPLVGLVVAFTTYRLLGMAADTLPKKYLGSTRSLFWICSLEGDWTERLIPVFGSILYCLAGPGTRKTAAFLFSICTTQLTSVILAHFSVRLTFYFIDKRSPINDVVAHDYDKTRNLEYTNGRKIALAGQSSQINLSPPPLLQGSKLETFARQTMIRPSEWFHRRYTEYNYSSVFLETWSKQIFLVNFLLWQSFLMKHGSEILKKGF